MDYISAKDAADKWGISQLRVAELCSGDRIPGAKIIGNMWIIPSDADKPTDARKVKAETANGIARPFLK